MESPASLEKPSIPKSSLQPPNLSKYSFPSTKSFTFIIIFPKISVYVLEIQFLFYPLAQIFLIEIKCMELWKKVKSSNCTSKNTLLCEIIMEYISQYIFLASMKIMIGLENNVKFKSLIKWLISIYIMWCKNWFLFADPIFESGFEIFLVFDSLFGFKMMNNEWWTFWIGRWTYWWT